MTYPSYFPHKYRYKERQTFKPPEAKQKQQHRPKDTITHIKRNKHHYQFIALSITLGLLSALAVTLANKTN